MWVSLPTESSLGGVATIFKMTQALQSPSFGEVIFQGDGWLITPRGCETCRWPRCHLTHSLLWIQLRRAAVPNLLGTRGWFHRRQSFMDQGGGDGFGMIQVHHIYCALYFCYYISSTTDHQLVDPRGWGPLTYSIRFDCCQKHGSLVACPHRDSKSWSDWPTPSSGTALPFEPILLLSPVFVLQMVLWAPRDCWGGWINKVALTPHLPTGFLCWLGLLIGLIGLLGASTCHFRASFSLGDLCL